MKAINTFVNLFKIYTYKASEIYIDSEILKLLQLKSKWTNVLFFFIASIKG